MKHLKRERKVLSKNTAKEKESWEKENKSRKKCHINRGIHLCTILLCMYNSTMYVQFYYVCTILLCMYNSTMYGQFYYVCTILLCMYNSTMYVQFYYVWTILLCMYNSTMYGQFSFWIKSIKILLKLSRKWSSWINLLMN